MSIRLNKAIRELNIGLQTAVDFLEKRKELGEVKSDLNFKLSDEQYGALVEAFKSDQDVKKDAAKLFPKKPKEKKRPAEPKENRAEDLLKSTPQVQFKPIGKIDLDSIGKKPAEKESAAPEKAEQPKKEVAAAVSPKPEKKVVEEKPKTEEPKEPKKEEKPQAPAKQYLRSKEFSYLIKPFEEFYFFRYKINNR